MASAASTLSRAAKFFFGAPPEAKSTDNDPGLSYLYYEDPSLGHSKCIPHTHLDVYSLPKAPYEMVDTNALLDLAMPIIHATQEATSFSRELWAREVWPIYKLAAFAFNSLPASERMHHSYPCGMFIHSCEVVCHAVQISNTVVFPTCVATDQMTDKRAWMLMIVTAGLFHDHAKLITDMDIVHPHAQKLFEGRGSPHQSETSSDGSLPADALSPLSLHVADEETRKTEYNEYICNPRAHYLHSWLTTFPESQRKYWVNYRPGRSNTHDLRPDYRMLIFNRVLHHTGLDALNPRYLDALLDSDSAAYKLVRYDIVDKADKTSALRTRRVDDAPSAMLAELIKQSVTLGFIKPDIEFPLKIDGAKILMRFPDDLITLNLTISTLDGYSVLCIKLSDRRETKCKKLLDLMAIAGIIECDASGKPTTSHGSQKNVTTFTAEFSKELVNLTPKVVEENAIPTSSDPQEYDLSETAMQAAEKGPLTAFDAAPDLGPRESPTLPPEPTVRTDLFKQSVCAFLEYLSNDLANTKPASMPLEQWQLLEPASRDNHPVFIKVGTALYIARAYITSYCSCYGQSPDDLLRELHFCPAIVADAHQVADDPMAVLSLTKPASYAVLQQRLAAFYRDTEEASPTHHQSGGQKYATWVQQLLVYFYQKSSRMEHEFGPFFAHDPARFILTKKLILDWLDSDGGAPRTTYNLKLQTVKSRLKEEPIEFSIVGDRIEIRGTIEDFLKDINAH